MKNIILIDELLTATEEVLRTVNHIEHQLLAFAPAPRHIDGVRGQVPYSFENLADQLVRFKNAYGFVELTVILADGTRIGIEEQE